MNKRLHLISFCLAISALQAQSVVPGGRPQLHSGGFRRPLATTTTPPIPSWTYTVTSPLDSPPKTYSSTIVGRNPYAHGQRTTTIPVYLVPLEITFDDGSVFTPLDTSSACSEYGNVAFGSILGPIFDPSTDSRFNYIVSGVDLGTPQYIDAVARAAFWKSLNQSKTNYHTKLSLPLGNLLAKISVTVPKGEGETYGSSYLFFHGYNTSCTRIGILKDCDPSNDTTCTDPWFSNYLTDKILPLLPGLGVPTNSLAVIMTNNVFSNKTGAIDDPDGFVTGFHTHNGKQYYVWTDYTTSGFFDPAKDGSSLSHEVGEWFFDPNGNNPTPSWGHIGQAKKCQGNLEVGDPLSGTILHVPSSFNLLVLQPVQDLAFPQWFYGLPSESFDGRYSFGNKLTTASTICK